MLKVPSMVKISVIVVAAAAQEAAALLAGVGGEHRQPHQRLPHSGPRVHALPAELI